MSAAEKLNMHKVSTDPNQRVARAILDARESGISIDEICKALDIMCKVRTGGVSTLVVRQDAKDKRALWIRASNYVNI